MEIKEEIRLVPLPCTASELESALHVACDHHGLWGAHVTADNELVPVTSVPGASIRMRRSYLKLARSPE